ncbi:hypothetical protein [Streptomyces sp. NPDC052036]|uniref:hypothetical protein n=1 Tax=Streptomyces sp. NPDC052036 TaxID=3155171 RepID=UPI00344AA827
MQPRMIIGVAPAPISFAAGQAAFTVTLVVVFNIGQDPDWHLALLRLQEFALGRGVSLLVTLVSGRAERRRPWTRHWPSTPTARHTCGARSNTA